jgi:prophage DNA circulation protein
MFKADALEALPILNATLDALLSWAPTQGRPGADLRTVVGDIKANAMELLQNDLIDMPLIRCFDLAFTTGINLYQVETVRRTTAAMTANSVGAIMTKDTLIELAFATAGYVISDMTFTSRADVEQIKTTMNVSFDDMEEELADQMDSMTWLALFKLHGAMSLYLVETARPLPQILAYRFYQVLPSVILAQRLYADASRADELRDENKVVHPAFCPREGVAMST